MSKGQRIRSVLLGLLMMAISVAMAAYPSVGLQVAIAILSITLIFMGLRYIVFYRRMARHMIGGLWILIIGVIIFDLGVFTFTMQDVPRAYVFLYLLGAYAFSGAVDILSALEARGYGAPSWKLKLSIGIINVLIAFTALLCGIFVKEPNIVVYIYCAGLCYGGIMKIITAFRRTAIVYIQ